MPSSEKNPLKFRLDEENEVQAEGKTAPSSNRDEYGRKTAYSWISQEKHSLLRVRYFFHAFVAFFFVFVSLFSWQPNIIADSIEVLKWEGDAFVTADEVNVLPFSELEQLQPNTTLYTERASTMDFLFDGRSSLRFDSKTKVFVHRFDRDDLGRFSLELSLIEGDLWMNDILSSDYFSIIVDALKINVRNAAVSIGREENEIRVFVDRRYADIELLLPSGETLTRFVVPEGFQFQIDVSRINEKLAKLRYSKLRKEFIRRLPERLLEKDKNEWVSLNREKDLKRYEAYKQNMLAYLASQDIQSLSPGTFFYQVREFVSDFSDFFILQNSKKIAFLRDRILEPLLSAQIYFARQQVDAAQLQLTSFREFFPQIPTSDVPYLPELSSFLARQLEILHDQSLFILPNEPFYEFVEVVRESQMILKPQSEQILFALDVARLRLLAVYDLLSDEHIAEAKAAFNSYKKYLLALLQDLPDAHPYEMQLFDEYLLVYNLIWESETFLDVKFFDVLSSLEKKVLVVFSDDIDQHETQLTFMSNKLRMLERLIGLMKRDEIVFDKAIALADLLISEAKDLQIKEGQYDVAVQKFFDDQIAEYRQVLRFFASTDFDLHGSYDDELYTKFVDSEKYFDEIKKLLEQSSSGTRRLRRTNPDEVIDMIVKDFSSSGFRVDGLEPLEKTDFRFFAIESGTFGDIAFRAKYDRFNKIVFDLRVEDFQFTTGVALENLANFIENLSMLDNTSPQIADETEDYTVIPHERSKGEEEFVRLVYLSLEDYDILADSSQISILDRAENKVFVNNAQKIGYEHILFSFEYDVKAERASQVEVETSLGSASISGTIRLKDLFSAVEAKYNASEANIDAILDT